MTLPTMKAGDDVQLTLRGKVQGTFDGTVHITLDGGRIPTSFSPSELTAPTARVEVLPPPVDPDLLLAREVASGRYEMKGPYDLGVLKGLHDDDPHVQIALTAIKASKAGGRV